ncbi:hypothetical protein JCGZ_03143 [Jatropha curcas]|uniref:Uncharacterized protein n=1 Tax=Jatropha curcas TaxID=180498 RepID=A0A067JDJ9_JATCU|nr:hypothetical protein JCGZ_03143 [Jatropha curcas]
MEIWQEVCPYYFGGLDVPAVAKQLDMGSKRYHGERVYEWKLGQDRWRVAYDVPYDMLSTRSIRLEWDIAAARRGSVATDHLAAFVLGAYAIFVQTQLLVHIPPPKEFDPFAKVEKLDRGHGDAPQRSEHVRKGFDCEAPDTAVVIRKPEYGPGRGTQCGGRAGHGAGCRPVIIEEIEESDSDDSEETTSNMS